VPGVEIAGATSRLPLLPGNSTRGIVVRDAPPNAQLVAHYRTASPDYFRAMGIPLLRGRGFEEADREDRPFVAVVSASAVQRFWPGRDALGERFAINEPEITIVGVVGDVRNDDIDAPPLPMVYVPLAQRASREMTIVMRTAGDPTAYVEQARAAIAAIDPTQPIYDVKSMAQILVEDLRQSVVLIGIIGIFALVALALAALGIYGVVAHAVAQRTHEIGVRMALGAAVGDVIRLVVRQGLVPVVAGLLIGMAAGVAVSQVMRGVLYGVTPGDPITYATAAIVLTAVALLACVAPARRATRVDPIMAIRAE
jgi:putative ABC transport system permease protein